MLVTRWQKWHHL